MGIEPKRHLAVIQHLMKASVLTSMQYRLDFILELFMSAFWVAWNVAPLLVVFSLRPTLAGFQLPEAMLVMSAFLILKSLIEGIINPNLLALVEHIRTGTFDFVLLKPVDSQLMVSASKIRLPKLIYFLFGIGIAIWSVTRIDPAPQPLSLLSATLMLASGAVCVYALWILVICTAFWLVQISNLSYLFNSIFDAARWPIGVFSGWVKIVLTFVLPIAIMTSFPALAALGRLELASGFLSVAISLGFVVLSRRVWLSAVRHYASASS